MPGTVSHHRAQRLPGGKESGGASRDRTGDLLVANQTLSQLSYGPWSVGRLALRLKEPPGRFQREDGLGETRRRLPRPPAKAGRRRRRAPAGR